MSARPSTVKQKPVTAKQKPVLMLPCLLDQASILHKNEVAIITKDRQFTYCELEARVQMLSAFFIHTGIGNNCRVIISLPSSVELVISLLSLIRIGAVACPINHKFPQALKNRVKDQLASEWLICPDSEHQDQTNHISLSSVKYHLELEPPAHKSSRIYYSSDAPCNIILTSGSSGTPKAAVFGYRQHYYSAQGANALIPLNPGDRNMVSLPLYHISGIAIIFRCLMAGATMVLPDGNDIQSNIEKYRITHASMVNTQLKRFLSRNTGSTTLKHVLVGGGPVAHALLDQAIKNHLNCWHTYGLTEMASQVFTHDPNGFGRTLPYRELSLSNQGEILVRGHTLFLGYFEQGTLRLPLNDQGWFSTSDIAELSDNDLKIVGRKDCQFISGGENIQPEDIEFFINQLEGVNQCVVVPKDDPEFGLVPVAFIDSDSQLNTESLRDVLTKQLPSFMIPKEVFAWRFNQGIKPNRTELKAIAANTSPF